MKKFSYICENKDFNLPTDKVTIMFTDIKGSSKLWADNESIMFEKLDTLETRLQKIIDKHDGFVVKTIGDSYMISFKSGDSLKNAVECAIDIQKSLTSDEIKVGKSDTVELRIGITYGKVYVKETTIQNKSLLDFFGNTVGSASRLESKVSEENGFAFSFLENIDNQDEILKLLEKEDIVVETIEFTEGNCPKEPVRTRSARLLTDLQINMCQPIENLKGVSSMRVFKCSLI